ncbi:MAG TPA: nuclear transport factor 2 family protein [Candidatus Nanoarchaeia archaeon]|nr:nuclear transport factor 2 family protein [Candidatus Nanoarchaeia archaeon]
MVNIKKTLTALEKKFWEADINKDANFYRKHTTNNSFAVGPLGIVNKKKILKAISSNPQKLLNFKIHNPSFVSFNNHTAFLIYKASGTTLNNSKKSRFSVLATSMYIKFNGRWLAAFHQQTPFK